MKFILISRHTGGGEIPEDNREQNLKDMMTWMTLLKAEIAMPIRGGKSVTERKVEDYSGDVGGLIIFEAPIHTRRLHHNLCKIRIRLF
jgi:hypothetical protein